MEPRLRSHVTRRVGGEVSRVERLELFHAPELLAVVVRELHRPVVARDAPEGARRVAEPILAIVGLRERGEDRARLFPLGAGDVLAVLDARHDARPELLREADVVRGQPARVTQSLARARSVVEPEPNARLVAVERELALDVVREGLLHREVRQRLAELPELLVELARLVDREDVLGVELRHAAPVLERAVLAAEGRLRPELAELLVDAEQAAPDVGLRREERAEELDELLEQGDERLLFAALAIERGEPLCRDGGARVLVDGRHEVAGGVVGVPHRDGPDVRRLAQPVRREAWVGRRHTHLLQQDRVRARIRLAGLVGVAERLLVVRVPHEALDEHLHLTGVHAAARTLQWQTAAVHL